MFLCFSIAALNLATAIDSEKEGVPDVEALSGERNQLIEVKQRIAGEKTKLEQRIDYLKGKIGSDEKALTGLHRTPATQNLAQDLDKLRRELEEINRQKLAAEAEVGKKKADLHTFNPWQEMGGAIDFKNPLFLECKDRVLVIHPGNRVLNVSDLNRKNALANLGRGHDGLVLLIRPAGFKTFEMAFKQAKKTGMKLAYEAVEADKRLDFTQGRSP